MLPSWRPVAESRCQYPFLIFLSRLCTILRGVGRVRWLRQGILSGWHRRRWSRRARWSQPKGRALWGWRWIVTTSRFRRCLAGRSWTSAGSRRRGPGRTALAKPSLIVMRMRRLMGFQRLGFWKEMRLRGVWRMWGNWGLRRNVPIWVPKGQGFHCLGSFCSLHCGLSVTVCWLLSIRKMWKMPHQWQWGVCMPGLLTICFHRQSWPRGAWFSLIRERGRPPRLQQLQIQLLILTHLAKLRNPKSFWWQNDIFLWSKHFLTDAYILVYICWCVSLWLCFDLIALSFSARERVLNVQRMHFYCFSYSYWSMVISSVLFSLKHHMPCLF